MSLIGEVIGPYRILSKIGEGGMAVVYKALDERLNRDVALKIIRMHALQRGGIEKRFELEARALAQIDHPHIVPVFDYGEYEGNPYLVMKYIEGKTLKAELGTPLLPDDAANLLAPIADALAYTHKLKIIHRDVKPSNILLDNEGKPYLTDFGVAKIIELDETLDLTGTGVGIGTPWYMAPEQAMGNVSDERSDIYSLGIVYYEMVTGRKPFEAETPIETILKHAREPLPIPSSIEPALPSSIDQLLGRALAKKPQDRFPSMLQFKMALDSVIQGKPLRLPIKARRVRQLLVLLLGLVTVVLGVVFARNLDFNPTHFISNVPVPTDTIDLDAASTLQYESTQSQGQILTIQADIAHATETRYANETSTAFLLTEAIIQSFTETPTLTVSASPTITDTPIPTPTEVIFYVTVANNSEDYYIEHFILDSARGYKLNPGDSGTYILLPDQRYTFRICYQLLDQGSSTCYTKTMFITQDIYWGPALVGEIRGFP